MSDDEIESGDGGSSAEANKATEDGDARDAKVADAGLVHERDASRDNADEAERDGDAGHADPDQHADASTSDQDASEHDASAGDPNEHDASAGDPSEHDAGPSHDAGNGGACSDLTYNSYGKEFVETYCISCHDSTGHSPKLDTLTNILAAKAKVKSEVLSKKMPMGKSDLTEGDRSEFAAWIDCGR